MTIEKDAKAFYDNLIEIKKLQVESHKVCNYNTPQQKPNKL